MAYLVSLTARAERDLAALYRDIHAEHSDAAQGIGVESKRVGIAVAVSHACHLSCCIAGYSRSDDRILDRGRANGKHAALAVEIVG